MTLCGTGSSFLQVTVVPVFTFKLFGTNFMPLMRTFASSPPALTPLLIFSCTGGCVCCAQLASNSIVIIRIKIVVLFISTAVRKGV